VIAEEVFAALHLAEMVFVPAGHPPHKPEQVVTAAHRRLAMLELAIESNPHFTISRVDLDREGPSYTVETLRLLREQWGAQTVIYFVMGWDNLEDLLSWYDPAGVLEQLDFLVAVQRPGYTVEDGYIEGLEKRLPGMRQRLVALSAPQLEISSSDLRQRVAEGRPIKYQVPEVVEQYIMRHGLYRDGARLNREGNLEGRMSRERIDGADAT
jgi:nicotinate-nucleotide adenylyltransferase